MTNGPGLKRGALDSSKYFKELDIPVSRLHDTELLSKTRYLVDYYQIFRDFSKNPDDPANYDFRDTDKLIEKLLTLNIEIIYRLGPSATLRNKDNHSSFPCDVEKLSRVFLRIVDHYVGGWANGFHYDIRKWEFWNEPDLRIFYSGNEDDFFKLYELFSLGAKSKYPFLEIGGCAFSGGTCNFAVHFIDYVKKHNLPLDFYSYHCYAVSPDTIKDIVYNVKRLLTDKSFENVTTVLDEWNFNINFNNRLRESYHHIGKITGACLVSGALCELQKAPVDIATYYDMQTNYMMFFYNGIFWFNGFKFVNKKPYYSFFYFKKLKELGKETFISALQNIYTLAASDSVTGRAVITNYSFENPTDREIEIEVNPEYKHLSLYRTDKSKNNRKVYSGSIPPALRLPANSINYFEFTK